MNDVLYIYGLEILTKNAQTRCSFFICPIGFHLMQMQFGFHMSRCNSWTCGFSIGLWTAVYLNTNAGNTGLGIGIIHYINFPMKQNATVTLLILILMTTLN
jgi:hypothetical protein